MTSTDRLLVVPTTHWDRAWYWPFERFRVKLIELFIQVEALWASDPAWRFTLDGQCIALLDYLEAFPEKAELYRRMGEAGRFRMGPHFVLADLWCTGAEALFRDLLLGGEIADRFAARQRAVYQPDTFGFPASVPSLLRHAGHDTFIFMRGMPASVPAEARFVRWRGADGAEVRVHRLRDGYANAAALGIHDGSGEVMDAKSSGIHPGFVMERAVAKLRAAAERLRDGQGGPLLLLAGVDHQIPQPQLSEIMARATGDGRVFAYGDLDEVADGMAAMDHGRWPLHVGECNAQPLGGTVGTRVYLKQANAAAEALLVQVAEPCDAILHGLGIDEPAGAVIPLAWRNLLTTHPHDDITGCSVDAVHRENELLIEKARQAGDAYARRATRRLIGRFGGQKPGDDRHGFAVLDTGGRGGRRRHRLVLDFEGRSRWGDVRPADAYRVVDEAGAIVPFRESGRWRATEHPHPQVELDLSLDLPPCTLRRFFIEPLRAWPLTATAPSRVLENAHLRAVVRDDATVDLTDLATGRTFGGLGFLGDLADVGDEYTVGPLPGDGGTRLNGAVAWRPVASAPCGGMQAVVLAGEAEVPASAVPGGHHGQGGRSSAAVRLPLEVTWSLAPGERHLSLRVRFTNTARDHRLRLGFPLGFMPAASDSAAFAARIERPVTAPAFGADGWLVLGHHPADQFVACSDAQGGLAVFTPFPHLYEVVGGAEPHLALTMLRAIGQLSVSQPMLTRGPGAGPDTPTPEAQCLRAFDMSFAVRPFAAAESDGLYAEALGWRRAALAGQLYGADPDRTAEADGPFLTLGEGPVVVSAFKRSQDRRGSILRLFNSSRSPAAAVVAGSVLKRLLPVLADERPTGEAEIPRGAHGWRVELPPLGWRSFRVDG